MVPEYLKNSLYNKNMIWIRTLLEGVVEQSMQHSEANKHRWVKRMCSPERYFGIHKPSSKIVSHGPLTPSVPESIYSPVKLGTRNLDHHTLMKTQLRKDRLRLRQWRDLKSKTGAIVTYKKRNDVVIERGNCECLMLNLQNKSPILLKKTFN